VLQARRAVVSTPLSKLVFETMAAASTVTGAQQQSMSMVAGQYAALVFFIALALREVGARGIAEGIPVRAGPRLHRRVVCALCHYPLQVGWRGVRLCGGQQQRVALARVLLKNAPGLADEVTAMSRATR
jgi:ABC-type hemin transport system ATPase subunit